MSTARPPPESLEAWRSLLTFVRAATTALDSELRRERGMGLDDYDVLYQLSQGPREGLRMSALATSLIVAPSSCTRLVGRLVELGWVERRPDPDDGRAVVVAATPVGRRQLARASLTHLRGIEEVFGSRLDEEARQVLTDLFRIDI